jgi:signal transduction histidine kinase
VTLASEDNQFRIEVADQGQGFDPSVQNAHSSQGLVRIGQRLQLIDGHMQIDSSPNKGTRVTLYVPQHGIMKNRS